MRKNSALGIQKAIGPRPLGGPSPGSASDILIIGHKLCSMLSILNELPLQKELQK